MNKVFESQTFLGWLESAVQTNAVSKSSGPARAMTMAALTKKLGFKSPRLVAMVLKGQRLPSAEFIARATKAFKLNSEETRYLELVARRQRLQVAGRDSSDLDREIASLSLKALAKTPVAHETLLSMGSWAFYPIDQIASIPALPIEAVQISRKLRGKISAENVEKILSTLLELGLLERNAAGQLQKSRAQNYRPPSDIPSVVVKRVHVEFMQRAVEALVETPPELREFRALTLRMDPRRVPEAKAMLREFLEKFDGRFHADDSENVYQMNLQFFGLS